MGTRSKTNVLDRDGNIIISIYRQFDGDTVHPKQLKRFLKRNRLANRINRETKCPEYQNGMEDLAGQLFCYLKTQTDSVMPAYPDTNNDWAYEYEIRFVEGSGICLKCRYYDTEVYKTTDWAVI